jgi:hypothetical protein
MTDTAIEIPAYITRAKSLAEMMQATADLLKQAADTGLPTPSHATLYQSCQEVHLGFRGERDSFHALADWATRFGGTVTGEPYTRDGSSELSVYCEVKFPYQGLTVEASAFIPADQLSIT